METPQGNRNMKYEYADRAFRIGYLQSIAIGIKSTYKNAASGTEGKTIIPPERLRNDK